jgi:hypothetical protein
MSSETNPFAVLRKKAEEKRIDLGIQSDDVMGLIHKKASPEFVKEAETLLRKAFEEYFDAHIDAYFTGNARLSNGVEEEGLCQEKLDELIKSFEIARVQYFIANLESVLKYTTGLPWVHCFLLPDKRPAICYQKADNCQTMDSGEDETMDEDADSGEDEDELNEQFGDLEL